MSVSIFVVSQQNIVKFWGAETHCVLSFGAYFVAQFFFLQNRGDVYEEADARVYLLLSNSLNSVVYLLLFCIILHKLYSV